MSGIAGIIQFDGAPVEPGLIERMTSAMAHRGPDGIRHWVKGSVALGQCMLRTTPESLEEHQPLANEDESLVLVMDGRVDNSVELRMNLKAEGFRFRGRTDAELVMRAYEAWGEESPLRLLGDFAFAVWDAHRRKLFCARDIFGVKPFSYSFFEGIFLFASELHALFEVPGVSKRPNEGMVAEYLAAAITSLDETLFEGVMRLPPAHALRVDQRGVSKGRYWDLDPSKEVRYSSDAGYAEHFKEILERSVESRVRCVGPLGSYLSGGVDSSAVAVLARSVLESQGRGGDLRTYSLVYPGMACDESGIIADVVAFGRLQSTQLPPVMPTPEYYADEVLRYQDFPGCPNCAPMFGPVRRAARADGVRVLLTGLGGDQLLESSLLTLADLLGARQLRRMVERARAEAALWKSPPPWWLILRHGVIPWLPQSFKRRFRELVAARRTGPWLSDRLERQLRARRHGRAASGDPPPPARFRAQDGLLGLSRSGWGGFFLETNDRDAAFHEVEERHPFYDRRLVEFMCSIPDTLRWRGDSTKHILRLALRGELPASVLERRGKAEFSELFKFTFEAFGAMTPEAFPQSIQMGWLDRRALKKQSGPDYSRVRNLMWETWMLVGVESWHRHTSWPSNPVAAGGSARLNWVHGME